MNAYAIVKTGGKQYTVKAGDVLRVERIPGKQEGDTVELTALAACIGSEMMVGSPALEQKVTATILSADLADKVMVFKKNRRKGYRVKRGHRQGHHKIRIDAIPEQSGN